MNEYVVGIGAANVDVYGTSEMKIRLHYDHPSIIKTGVGGVTRNILENISRLGVRAKLLSAIGDDIYGDLVREKSCEAGIDMDHIKLVKGGRTSIFMQVMDSNNDMHIALCDMSINKNINTAYIKKNASIIKNAAAVILDPSLPNDVLEYILDNFTEVPIFVDPISDNYAKKIKPYLSKFYCLKPNKTELATLANMKIETDEDLIKAYKRVIKKGVKKLYVSLGKGGCLYTNDDGEIVRAQLKPVENMVNASGAGDSFFATIIYGTVKGFKEESIVNYAMAAGIATIGVKETINPKLSIAYLDKVLKKHIIK
ncbi:MAG: carbohydrate kinase family protein [Erysipelotrichaceae bacterium]|nr:carbohydrate kinase family protein [Erysipelotrichaceae bacterium]